jgi:hypothetical protein
LRDAGHNPPSFATCKRAANVVRVFKTARRRALVSFEHHKTVAGLDERDQDWMLERAERSNEEICMSTELAKKPASVMRSFTAREGDARYGAEKMALRQQILDLQNKVVELQDRLIAVRKAVLYRGRAKKAGWA